MPTADTINKLLKTNDFLNECCKARSALFNCESCISNGVGEVSPFFLAAKPETAN